MKKYIKQLVRGDSSSRIRSGSTSDDDSSAGPAGQGGPLLRHGSFAAANEAGGTSGHIESPGGTGSTSNDSSQKLNYYSSALSIRKLWMEYPQLKKDEDRAKNLRELVPLFCRVFNSCESEGFQRTFGEGQSFAFVLSRKVAVDIRCILDALDVAPGSSEDISSSTDSSLADTPGCIAMKKLCVIFSTASSIPSKGCTNTSVDAVRKQSSRNLGVDILSALSILSDKQTNAACMVQNKLPLLLIDALSVLLDDTLSYRMEDSEQEACDTSFQEGAANDDSWLRARMSAWDGLHSLLVRLLQFDIVRQELLKNGFVHRVLRLSCVWGKNSRHMKNGLHELIRGFFSDATLELLAFLSDTHVVEQSVEFIARLACLDGDVLVPWVQCVLGIMEQTSTVSPVFIAEFEASNGAFVIRQSVLRMMEGWSVEDATADVLLILDLLRDFSFIGEADVPLSEEVQNTFLQQGDMGDMIGMAERRIRNLSAFKVLCDLLLMLPSEDLQMEAYQRVLEVIALHPYNYPAVYSEGVVGCLLRELDNHSEQVQHGILKIVEYVVTAVNFVPLDDIRYMVSMISQSRDSSIRDETLLNILQAIWKLISFDPQLCSSFNAVGVAGALCVLLKRENGRWCYRDEKKSRIVSQDDHDESMSPAAETVVELAQKILLDSLSRSPEIVSSFRRHGGIKLVCSFILSPSSIFYSLAFRVLNLLISKDVDQIESDIASVIELLHMTPKSNFHLRSDVFAFIQSCMIGNTLVKDSFCTYGGFDSCVSILLFFQRDPSYVLEPYSPTGRASARHKLVRSRSEQYGRGRSDSMPVAELPTGDSRTALIHMLRMLFSTIALALANHPRNQLLFTESELPAAVASAIEMSILVEDVRVRAELYQCLVDMAMADTVVSARTGSDAAAHSTSSVGSCFSPRTGSFVDARRAASPARGTGAEIQYIELMPQPVLTTAAPLVAVVTTLATAPMYMQKSVMMMLNALAGYGPRNRELMSDIDLLHTVLEVFGDALQSFEHPIHHDAVRFVELLGSHRWSPKSLRQYLALLQSPNCARSLVQSLNHMAYHSMSLPFIEFDAKHGGYAHLSIEGLENRQWPPSNGYSVSCWFRYDFGPSSTEPKRFYVVPEDGDAARTPSESLHARVTRSRTTSVLNRNSVPGSRLRVSSEPAIDHPKVRHIGMSPVAPSPGSSTTSIHVEDDESVGTDADNLMEKFTLLKIASKDMRTFLHIYVTADGFVHMDNHHDRSSTTVTFRNAHLKSGRWYHIALTHQRFRFQDSKATLYVDGLVRESEKITYLASSTSSPVAGIIGLSHTPAMRHCGMSENVIWTLGPMYVVEEILNREEVKTMFIAGPNYHGFFQGNQLGSVLPLTPCFPHGLISCMQRIDMSQYRMDEAVTPQSLLNSPLFRELLPMPSFVLQPEKIVFAFSALLKRWSSDIAETDPAMSSSPVLRPQPDVAKPPCWLLSLELSTVQSRSQSTLKSTVCPSPIRWYEIPSMNETGAELPENKRGSTTVVDHSTGIVGVLVGGAFPCRPSSLCDDFRAVHGLELAFTLLERASSRTAIDDVLCLIATLLRNSDTNLDEMDRIHGYQCLTHLLRRKASMVSERGFDAVLSICLGIEFSSAVLDPSPSKKMSVDSRASLLLGRVFASNMLAIESLLLDFEIWKNSDSTIQRRIFDLLTGLISTTPYAMWNLMRLRSLRMLPLTLHALFEEHIPTHLVDRVSTLIRMILVKEQTREAMGDVTRFVLSTVPWESGKMQRERTEVTAKTDAFYNTSPIRLSLLRMLYSLICGEDACPIDRVPNDDDDRHSVVSMSELEAAGTTLRLTDLFLRVTDIRWFFALLNPENGSETVMTVLRLLMVVLCQRPLFLTKFRQLRGFGILEQNLSFLSDDWEVYYVLLCGLFDRPELLAQYEPDVFTSNDTLLAHFGFDISSSLAQKPVICMPEVVSVILSLLRSASDQQPLSILKDMQTVASPIKNLTADLMDVDLDDDDGTVQQDPAEAVKNSPVLDMILEQHWKDRPRTPEDMHSSSARKKWKLLHNSVLVSRAVKAHGLPQSSDRGAKDSPVPLASSVDRTSRLARLTSLDLANSDPSRVNSPNQFRSLSSQDDSPSTPKNDMVESPVLHRFKHVRNLSESRVRTSSVGPTIDGQSSRSVLFEADPLPSPTSPFAKTDGSRQPLHTVMKSVLFFFEYLTLASSDFRSRMLSQQSVSSSSSSAHISGSLPTNSATPVLYEVVSKLTTILFTTGTQTQLLRGNGSIPGTPKSTMVETFVPVPSSSKRSQAVSSTQDDGDQDVEWVRLRRRGSLAVSGGGAFAGSPVAQESARTYMEANADPPAVTFWVHSPAELVMDDCLFVPSCDVQNVHVITMASMQPAPGAAPVDDEDDLHDRLWPWWKTAACPPMFTEYGLPVGEATISMLLEGDPDLQGLFSELGLFGSTSVSSSTPAKNTATSSILKTAELIASIEDKSYCIHDVFQTAGAAYVFRLLSWLCVMTMTGVRLHQCVGNVDLSKLQLDESLLLDKKQPLLIETIIMNLPRSSTPSQTVAFRARLIGYVLTGMMALPAHILRHPTVMQNVCKVTQYAVESKLSGHYFVGDRLLLEFVFAMISAAKCNVRVDSRKNTGTDDSVLDTLYGSMLKLLLFYLTRNGTEQQATRSALALMPYFERALGELPRDRGVYAKLPSASKYVGSLMYVLYKMMRSSGAAMQMLTCEMWALWVRNWKESLRPWLISLEVDENGYAEDFYTAGFEFLGADADDLRSSTDSVPSTDGTRMERSDSNSSWTLGTSLPKRKFKNWLQLTRSQLQVFFEGVFGGQWHDWTAAEMQKRKGAVKYISFVHELLSNQEEQSISGDLVRHRSMLDQICTLMNGLQGDERNRYLHIRRVRGDLQVMSADFWKRARRALEHPRSVWPQMAKADAPDRWRMDLTECGLGFFGYNRMHRRLVPNKSFGKHFKVMESQWAASRYDECAWGQRTRHHHVRTTSSSSAGHDVVDAAFTGDGEVAAAALTGELDRTAIHDDSGSDGSDDERSEESDEGDGVSESSLGKAVMAAQGSSPVKERKFTTLDDEDDEEEDDEEILNRFARTSRTNSNERAADFAPGTSGSPLSKVDILSRRTVGSFRRRSTKTRTSELSVKVGGEQAHNLQGSHSPSHPDDADDNDDLLNDDDVEATDAEDENYEEEYLDDLESMLDDPSTSQQHTIRHIVDVRDRILQYFNCCGIHGLDSVDGVFLICKYNMYYIENYSVDADGSLVELRKPSSLAGGDPSLPDGMSPIASVSRDIGVDGAADTPHGPVPLSRDMVDHPYQIWSYDEVCSIHKRSYLLRPVALEVFMVDGRSQLLVFNPKERDVVYQQLMGMRMSNYVGLGTPTSLLFAGSDEAQRIFGSTFASMTYTGFGNNSSGNVQHEADTARMRALRKYMTKQWRAGLCSNFEYLMFLNTLAGRSYNDLTQYPVFPWVLQDYESETLDLQKTAVYRDLTLPMGQLNEDRGAEFRERFESWDDPQIPKFHYGTHYSSAASVLYFLVRMEPFATQAMVLQGGRFDHPDRLFYDIRESWLSASGTGQSSNKTLADVKELIPEFYHVPEFLVNRDRFDFGHKLGSGERISSVKLPPWARDDPREFIRGMRRALESSYVSQHIHHWIDLVFGHKQRGKAAEDACNVFYFLTYEGAVDIDAIADDVLREATIAQIHNFGQTPRQLFNKPHPRRLVTNPQPLYGVWSHPELLMATEVKQVLSVRGGVGDLRIVKEKIVASEAKTLLLPKKFAKALSWGYADFSLRLHSATDAASSTAGGVPTSRGVTKSGRVRLFEGLHVGQVSCVVISEDGRFLVTGGDDTVVSVWRVLKGKGAWKPTRGGDNRISRQGQIGSPGLFSRTVTNTSMSTLSVGAHGSRGGRRGRYIGRSMMLEENMCGHEGRITALAVSSSFHVIVSGSVDTTCIVWDMNSLSYVRTLQGHDGPISCISINESTGDVATASGVTLQVWSCNGELLYRCQTSQLLSQPITALASATGPEWLNGDMIISGHSDGSLRFWSRDESQSKIICPDLRGSTPATASSRTSTEKAPLSDTGSGSDMSGTSKSVSANDENSGRRLRSESIATDDSRATNDNEEIDADDDAGKARSDSASPVPLPSPTGAVVSPFSDRSAAPMLLHKSVNIATHGTIEDSDVESGANNTAEREAVSGSVHSVESDEGYEPSQFPGTLILRATKCAHSAPVTCIRLSAPPEHKKLYSGDADGRIMCWTPSATGTAESSAATAGSAATSASTAS